MPLPSQLLPLRLTAFEHRGRTERGVTQSHRVVARDGEERPIRTILKLRDPETPRGRGHFGPISLACELTCAIVARAVGLRVPDYAIVEVGPIFAGRAGGESDRPILERNRGPNFGSVEILPRPLAWRPDCSIVSVELRQAIDDVLSFDATVLNGDRTNANPNLLWDGRDQVHVIDHGLAVPLHDEDETVVATSPLLPEGEIRRHCGYPYLRGKRPQFALVHQVWSGTIDHEFWAGVRAVIPREWEGRPGELDRVFRFLTARSERFRDIMVELRRVVQ